MVSDDFLLVDVLGQCKSSFPHLHVCPAYVFTFTQAGEAFCALSLIKSNSSHVIEECTYTPVDDKTIFHVYLLGVQYFYYPTKTGVTVFCQGNDQHFIAEGYYVAPDHCEIRSAKISTFPTHQHLAFVSNLISELTTFNPFLKMNFTNVSVVSYKLKFLSYLNDSSFSTILEGTLPMYLSHSVLLPSVLVPFLIIVFYLCFVLYCFKRITSDYAFLLMRQVKATCSHPKDKDTKKKKPVQVESEVTV